MQSLRDALEHSERDGVAIGHFNVSDWVLLKAQMVLFWHHQVKTGRSSPGTRQTSKASVKEKRLPHGTLLIVGETDRKQIDDPTDARYRDLVCMHKVEASLG